MIFPYEFTIWIFIKKSFVAIREILPRVIRRINVDDIDLASMGKVETCEGVVIVTFNENVSRFPVSVSDFPFRNFF